MANKPMDIEPMPLAEALAIIRKVYEDGKQLYKHLDSPNIECNHGPVNEEAEMEIEEMELRDFAINTLMVSKHIRDSYSHNMTKDTLNLLDLQIRSANRFLDRIKSGEMDIHV